MDITLERADEVADPEVGDWERAPDALGLQRAIAAFAQAGARLRGVPVDRNGVQIAELEAALADRPALVYLQSTVHSPTGAILSDGRRRVVSITHSGMKTV